MKSHLFAAEVFLADARTDWHEEFISRFLQICESVQQDFSDFRPTRHQRMSSNKTSANVLQHNTHFSMSGSFIKTEFLPHN
jgi:hypothetical protein